MVKFKLIPLTYNYLVNRAGLLKRGWKTTGGRNSKGIITSYKKGPFKYKRLYRFIDFWRRLSADAFLVKFERDNFRSVHLTLVFYQTGYLSYLILPEGLKLGDKINFSYTYENSGVKSYFAGNALPLKFIQDGAMIFNVELWPFKGAQICRAAGTYAILIGKRGQFAYVKLRSGWKMALPLNCYATLGVAPNYKHSFRILRKAGLRVNLGRRPTVRGVAMNAIDHPHGGGRGKTSGGPRPRSPWGAITKQRKTVLKKAREAKILIRYR